MIGEFILCASIAMVVMLPAWADNPSSVVQMVKRQRKR